MLRNDIGIRNADGGYIITTENRERVFFSLEEVFLYLLSYYEGLSPTFSGSLHGEVIVIRGEEKEISR